MADKCSHSTSVCNFCEKKGHIAKVCFKKKKEGSCHTTHLVTATATQEVNTNEGNGDTPDCFTVYMQSVKSSDSPTPTPPLTNFQLQLTIKSFRWKLTRVDFSKLGGHIETLKSPTVILKSYTGNIAECLGEKEMELKIGDQLDTLLVRVVKGPSILGRDLMAEFKLPWQNIFHMVSTTSEDIVSQYPNLFNNTTVLGSANSLANLCQILQELPHPYTSYFVRKIYAGNGGNWNKKLSITSKPLCAPILFYGTTIQLLN